MHLAFALLLCCFPIFAARTVAIVPQGTMDSPAKHGLAKLEQALRQKGFEVADRKPDFAVVAQIEASLGVEALSIRRDKYKGKPALRLSGGDARGLMYAALDVAERVSSGNDPFEHVREISEKPYLAERGVSMYTMQRALFESRLYDERHWQRYFDMLAASRINSFVVIFGYENGGFMAPLYPYFFDVEQFPNVQMTGLTREQQARNTAAFKAMMRMAHERGIEVTAGIWDHIYRGGVQGGGIPGASETAGKRVPGLVWGVTADNLAPYTKAALRKFLNVFPEVDAIQFRMHDESGLKHEEMAGFWHEVFGIIKQTKPNMRVDLRAKGLPDPVIDDALSQGLNARINTKYWMEQMGLPFHPTHVNKQNQRDRRHGYADLLRYPQKYRVHWQLWSGGTTRLLLWGDPEYVRRFAESAKLYDGNSFEVNEMLATKMLGEPHDAKPRDILNPQYRYYDYEFERYWHFYRLWGRLTYNPQTPAETWERPFTDRFGEQAGAHVRNALHLASKVLPRIVAASYRYQYFPTTRGWAELQRQDSLPKFAAEEGSDTQQFMNARDEARSIIEGPDTAMRRPTVTSRWFAQTSQDILAEAAQAEQAIGAKSGNEFRSTIADLKILAGLAQYHSWRLRAAVSYNLYKEAGDLSSFDDAIGYERRAIDAWRGIVASAGDVYSEDLAFGVHQAGFSRHWKEELQLLERDFAQLQAERQNAKPRADAKAVRVPMRGNGEPAVSVVLQPVAKAEPGSDLRIAAKVSAPATIKWVRLRYRHLTQYEDYQTAEMKLDSRSGSYTGTIPGAFIDPKWDLMYFVEAVDVKGSGGMFPDLETATPYIVIPVDHTKAAASYVRVSQRDHRYLEFTDGKPYIPIGLNMVSPPYGNKSEDEAMRGFDAWLTSLSANGGNYIRVWLSSPFWDVEHEKSGVYDKAKAERIDKMLAMCRQHGIRVKLTMEHFRSIGGGRQPWADKPLHNVANGGPAKSIADFFDGEASREQFKRKIQWYAERYGDQPTVYGWELWNEINAVTGGDYMAWTQSMLPELHKAFPKNMAMQSLGSFDTDRVRDRYRRHSTMVGNDVAQVHRYLDLGASLEVCKGPVDVLAADAVRELLSYDVGRPVLLAESGAVEPKHAGPFQYYRADREGMLLHDILFAPFFAGAAGPGQIWHWDAYVAANNLWHHFGRFAEAVKGLDPPAEAFEPSMAPHERLRVYALKGRRTMLLWCRDAKNTWESELKDGEKPELLKGVVVNVPAKDKVRIYDPWANRWSDAMAKNGKVTLPPFSRSIVVRVDN